MTHKTHSVFGATLYFPIIALCAINGTVKEETIPILLIIGAIGSLAPDLDEKNSFLSKIPPFFIIAILLSSLFKHRGPTHWFISSFIYGGISWIIGFLIYKDTDISNCFSLIGTISYLSHILSDGMTVSGIRNPYMPLKRGGTWFTVPKILRVKTMSAGETIYFLIFSLLLGVETIILLDYLRHL